jgi:FKBP-type peptidyl-prolyl cis-trans isomerase FkpA
MSSKMQRIFILIIAVIFIISTIGIGVFYVLDAQQQQQQSKEIEDALKQAQDNQNKEGKLEGTQLQNFTPDANITALKTEDTVVGTGKEAKAGDTVTVHYTGAVAATGTIFQSSLDSPDGQPIPLSLNQVIQGWAQGIPGMKEGGTRRLYIPADLAYGANSPSASIPPNSALVFDVVLTKVGE